MIATDSTSAGVEAYLAGLRVIVYTYPKRLNFSPLKGVEGIHFVNTPAQLMYSLTENRNVSIVEPEPFFWTDRSLPRWSKLFQNAGYPNFN
jgi:surface carbohydrate biosynthesis protein (TIGR04326 family)